jgi:hypothetical protein
VVFSSPIKGLLGKLCLRGDGPPEVVLSLAHKILFPGKRMGRNDLLIVVLRRPIQQ